MAFLPTSFWSCNLYWQQLSFENFWNILINFVCGGGDFACMYACVQHKYSAYERQKKSKDSL